MAKRREGNAEPPGDRSARIAAARTADGRDDADLGPRLTAIENREQFEAHMGVAVTKETGDGLFDVVELPSGESILAAPSHAGWNQKGLIAVERKGSGKDESFELVIQSGDKTAVVKIVKGAADGKTELLPIEGVGPQPAHQGLIPPPYRMDILIRIWDRSCVLPQIIDAMARNIDGFGYQLEPVIDFKAPDIDDKIREIILEEGDGESKERKALKAKATELRKSRKADADEETPEEDPDGDPMGISDEEVEIKREELERLAQEEWQSLTNFFEYAGDDIPFTQLRIETRKDIEITGSGYWEVLRNEEGDIVAFRRGESETFRISPEDPEWVEVEENRRVGILKFEKARPERRFRRYAQIDRRGLRVRWFKTFGDPRPMLAVSGQFITEDEAKELNPEDPREVLSNEVIHFREFAKLTPYGRPRWVGCMLEVLGIRQAAELNYDQFDNKMIPPMVILVAGGKMGTDHEKRIARIFTDHARGQKNWNRIVVLEATQEENNLAEGRGTVRMTLVPLTQHMPKDGMFLVYSDSNTDRVESVYRMPKLMLGRTKDFNRSCYSADTETLTENGWKLHQEISADEKIAVFDKDRGEVVFKIPKAKHVYDVEGETLIRFENTHTDVLVTPEHTMLIRPYHRASDRDRTFEVHKAGEIPYERFEVALAADEWYGDWGQAEFKLPKTDGCKIERGHTHDPIRFDDWLEFLGYFVSEGGLLTTNHPAAPYLVYVDQKHPEKREKIRACLDRLGWKYSTQEKPCGTTHFLFSNRCLRDWLIRNAGTHAQDKRLPMEYCRLSPRMLTILLDALMLGDGTVDSRENRTNKTYYSSSTILAGQVQQILLLLGKRSTIGQGAGVWRVMFSEHKTTVLRKTESNRTPASISRVHYRGEVYCFEAPGYGFFVTRRNGKIAIQGNTAEVALEVAESQVFAPEREEMDAFINFRILRAKGIRFWTFKSRGVSIRNQYDRVKIGIDVVKAGMALPGEMRPTVEEAFQTQLDPLPEAAAKVPLSALVAIARMLGPEALRLWGVDPKEIDGVDPMDGPPGDGEPRGPMDDPVNPDDVEEQIQKMHIHGLVLNDGTGMEILKWPAKGDDPQIAERKAERIRRRLKSIGLKVDKVMGKDLDDSTAPELMRDGILDGDDPERL